MLLRIVGLIFGFALGALLITLWIANRHPVRFGFDPFSPHDPVVYVTLPLYFYLMLMLIVGVLIGGFATWMSQGRWRRVARIRTQESLRWKAEAERLARERDQRVGEKKTLALARR